MSRLGPGIAGVVIATLVQAWLGYTPVLAQEQTDQAASLEEQLAAQQAKNEALQRRIASLEAVLKTDVCQNPEAQKLVDGDPEAATQ